MHLKDDAFALELVNEIPVWNLYNWSWTQDFQQDLYVRPAKTHASLYISAVWSESLQDTERSQASKASSSGQRRLWSDCVDAQADLSIC